MINGAQYVRRELMIRLVRAFDEGNLLGTIDQIPVKMRPKNAQSSRCCVYHDRAVLKYRLMSILGISCEEEDDEAKKLSEYLAEKIAETIHEPPAETPETEQPVATDDPAQLKLKQPLTVCPAGCSGCPDARVVVTGNCRGCFARPCLYNCPVKAITIENHRSTINPDKCVKCGKCITVCPYHAIVKTTVPCEEVCPAKAIHKNEYGVAEIDFEKCCYCGKCFNACPFGAILERSQIVDLLLAMKRGDEIIAMVAPSAQSQFPGTIEQLFTAIHKLGFSDVMEVALGAEMTTAHETEEFKERIAQDPKGLMTTSCCPAYVELVRKHLPAFMSHVSTTPSPMVYARDIVKADHPNAKVVFIGPCIAKRQEALRTGVDFVISFEELGSLLAGRSIDVIACEPWPIPRPAAATARNFQKSCGVTDAVLHEAAEGKPDFKLNSKHIDGIDAKTVNLLKLYGAGKLPVNFLEVMACTGGCINGPCSLVAFKGHNPTIR